MRAVIYAVAAVAAIGIFVGISTMPSPVDQTTESATSISTDSRVMEDAGTLTMAVPGMHCQYSCFPKVKETLEGIDGVTEVVLDEQKDDTVLDNRQVVVTYEPGFDVAKALTNLTDRGFADSDVVQ